MGYLRISKENSFCVYEHQRIEKESLKLFFIIGRGQVVFVKNKLERIVGIISSSDYEKSIKDGKYHINKVFKNIIYCPGYMEEVERFFKETEYQSVPILNVNGELVESFVRTRRIYLETIASDKWIDAANMHLASLIKKKGYKKIRINRIDLQSDLIYRYFKNYEFLYDIVEKVWWYDIGGMTEEEIVITESKIDVDTKATVYSLDSLRIELEYNLLLQNCKKSDVKLYMVSIPTIHNVWNVTKEEQKRISQGYNWRRYLENKEQYSELWEQVLGISNDKDEFIDSLMNLPPVVVKESICYLREHISKYVNVINGNRLTEGAPTSAPNCVYLSGNSFLFGPLVDDGHTVASMLQRLLNKTAGFTDYRVVNEGIRGGTLYESLKKLNFDHFFKRGDIIVLLVGMEELFCKLEDDAKKYILDNIKIYHLEDVFNALDRKKVKSYFIETPAHPNAFGYQIAAEYLMRIFKEKSDDLWRENLVLGDSPTQGNGDIFRENAEDWVKYLELLETYKWDEKGTKGAIIMNCNPLTYGHQYLIEYAKKLVDYLYIFVVQEDKSEYSFEERFEMVQACVESYSNIAVIPSGRFVISSITFPQYFTKQIESPETVIDTSNDIRIFGKHIAPILNITMRFAGEEPTDFVTAQYNDCMRNLLPEYGIEFVEIPRYSKEGMGIISASKVRDAVQKKEWGKVKKLVPEKIYQILYSK